MPRSRRDEREAARGLALYFAILLPLSALGYWLWVARRQHTALIFVPAVASAAARLARREGFADVSFRLGRGFGRAAAAALGVPLAACSVAYGGAWAAGLVDFAPARLPAPFPSLGDPRLHFAWTALLSLTVVTAFFVPLAAGEEVGWRGYLLPRMVEAGVPRPLLASGLVWALWHVPLIVAGAYGPGAGAPAAAALVFVPVATAYGVFVGHLRLTTGSVWPAVLAHAAWNALTQACFNPAVKPRLWPWLGESGLLVAAVLPAVVAAALRLRAPRPAAGGAGP
ncbi:MAG TPA: CPBP family intramembrane glutamic endopeptidase [Polyangiaceae bacterium]|nr:CPBP family intramembrane glutamic endopeptidase [Polyangiaceae bacterium]